MLAEEECALGGHETKNITCCAKHHEEIPCKSCSDAKASAIAVQQQPPEASKNESQSAK